MRDEIVVWRSEQAVRDMLAAADFRFSILRRSPVIQAESQSDLGLPFVTCSVGCLTVGF